MSWCAATSFQNGSRYGVGIDVTTASFMFIDKTGQLKPFETAAADPYSDGLCRENHFLDISLIRAYSDTVMRAFSRQLFFESQVSKSHAAAEWP